MGRVRFLTYQGKTMRQRQWAIHMGTSQGWLSQNVKKLGVEGAITRGLTLQALRQCCCPRHRELKRRGAKEKGAV